MAAIAFIFFLSLGVTLSLTPVIRKISIHRGWVDAPSDRKVHVAAMPRLGGVAIYIGFLFALLFLWFFPNNVIRRIYEEPLLIWITLGSVPVFLMGVWDDFKHLNPFLKLAVQIAAASITYFGGIQINELATPWGTVYALGILSFPVTIFWFILVINALNLIDGLDGLAAGVSLFATLSLLLVSLLNGNIAVAFGLAALAGACLGFLRYNFNPASIFMGDGGSYFLGYMLASLGILGSMKSQTTVAILIPIIALGVPLMDTLLAPVRRFIIGKGLFQPDKNHFHHCLLKKGFSHRKAVLIIYVITFFMGVFALISVHAADKYVGLFFLVLALLLFLGIRQLGYLEYLAVDKVLGYFRDVTDEIGIQRDRRTFLGYQKAITETHTMDETWQCVIAAVKFLNMDRAEISLIGNYINIKPAIHYQWYLSENTKHLGIEKENMLSLSLPLVNHKYHGTLYIKKDLDRSPLSRHTLRRIEQLRRTLVDRLTRFQIEAEHQKTHCEPMPADCNQPLEP